MIEILSDVEILGLVLLANSITYHCRQVSRMQKEGTLKGRSNICWHLTANCGGGEAAADASRLSRTPSSLRHGTFRSSSSSVTYPNEIER